MVPTKKINKTPYELWYRKVPNLSYLKVWGCEALVKRDTPDKLQQRYVKCIFIGYPKQANKTSASVSQVETSNTPPSNTSVEMPRVESVRPSGVIIEDWVSDDEEDIFQSEDSQTTVKPSFKKIEFTKARNETVKSDKQAVKPRMVTQSPKVDRKDWNGKMTQKLGLGFGFTKKACFVCGSHNHLIKDCDFHEKRMPKESVLRKGTGHKEVRPIWNNTQRINHQNKFVPTAVLTRSGRIPVSTAKQNVNTATPKNRVNVSKSKINTFPKSHSPIRRPFYKPTVLNTKVSKEKVNIVRVNGVNTAGQTAVSTVKGNGVTAVKALTGCVWRPKKTDLNNGSKDNSGSWISKRGNPQQALKYKGMFDSGCSRHMTGNKALLTDYQDIDGGFVAFGGNTRGGKITVSKLAEVSIEGLYDESYKLETRYMTWYGCLEARLPRRSKRRCLFNQVLKEGDGGAWWTSKATKAIVTLRHYKLRILVVDIVSSGWSFVSAVPSQMTYPVASLTLDSARSSNRSGIPVGITSTCHCCSLCFQSRGGTLCSGIYSGGKKSQESNIGDSDNTGDGDKTARGGIVTYGGLIASYACMISIYESSCKGEKTSVTKRYLVKSFEESGEVFSVES
ncbi:hypothetical protein Tco_0210206 [Tanacetum coccineum]